ncbi:MAG: arylamine N-acetyltransferase [Chloroflexota bacterium]|nr:arylamine N-acetyltransferase [Chloroflexota bacterium]MDE2948074.1 arylamine N-acetyltransferase [Chloroflexota bacterium]
MPRLTAVPPLSKSLSQRLLHHFDLAADPPADLETLRRLVERFTQTVPWESASRIVRRARHESATDCALLGEAYWEAQLASGSGGTCYESNYAFFSLLRRLGYGGYLTINDIGGAAGCHSAIVILLNGGKYLVDVGFPVHVVLPMQPDRRTSAESPVLNYSIEREEGDRWRLRRDPSMRVGGFILHDVPVGDAEYRAIAIHDYRHDGGQFLDAIVIQKVVGGQLWRFHSDVRPYVTQQFVDGQRRDHALGVDVAAGLAERFGIKRDLLAEAMSALGLPPAGETSPAPTDGDVAAP